MASPAQALANLQNAQHSTGPKTEAGKAKVAQNSVRHGLFAAYERLLPEAAELVNQFIAELPNPISNPTQAQQRIIRDYAVAIWRNELYRKLEASYFQSALADEIASPEAPELVATFGKDILWGRAMIHDAQGPNVLSKLMRYHSRIEKELRQTAAAYHQMVAEAVQTVPEKTNPIPPKPQAQQAQPTPQTPRNALCPCGSGIKYKRCCGEQAPAFINAA